MERKVYERVWRDIGGPALALEGEESQGGEQECEEVL
tara:strand:+ start:50 stop:160 length:111 start_codon:yes stop_codon:yes gene_type:complete